MNIIAQLFRWWRRERNASREDAYRLVDPETYREMSAELLRPPPPGAVRTLIPLPLGAPGELQVVARDVWPNGGTIEHLRQVGKRSGIVLHSRRIVLP